MNKLLIQQALLGALVCFAALSAQAGETEKTGVTKAAGKAMDGVKNVASKGAESVSKMADGITVRVERFTNPPEHKPGQHNIVMSAVRGVGRLIRNVTTETARFVGTVGRAGVNLGAKIPAATYGTVREAANRIANPRKKPSSSNEKDVQTPSSSGQEASSPSVDAANSENAQVPAELSKND